MIYTLPHTVEGIRPILAPSLERIDVTKPSIQLVILTADAESAVALSEVVYAMMGPQGIEVVPVTSANRAARLLEERPVHAVAGPPLELQTLVQRSTLKLGDVRTVVLAWLDDVLSSGTDAVASLEALFAELPKEAARTVVARSLTPPVEEWIDRYARTARRMTSAPETESRVTGTTIEYVVVAATSRPAVLRRLLDDLDPPSAAVVVRSDTCEQEVRETLRQLGYRRADDPVRMVRGTVDPNTHTVILYDVPVTQADLSASLAEGVVHTIALTTARQLESFRTLAGPLTPFALHSAGAAARQRDRMLRDELSSVLVTGVASREILALEPLLEQYDGIEIAAAAVRLLEQARAAAAVAVPAAVPRHGPRDSDGERTRERPKREFGDRPPKREFGDRPKRDFGDRPKRDFGDRPKRDFGDRPKRDFGDRPPRRDFNDRRHRNTGRGPRER